MARYMLTGIDDEKWRRFKAACDLQGITMRDSFIHHINYIIMEGIAQRVKAEADYHKKEKEVKKK